MWGSTRWDPSPVVQYCLQATGLQLADIDLIVWSHIDHVAAEVVAHRLAAEGGAATAESASSRIIPPFCPRLLHLLLVRV